MLDGKNHKEKIGSRAKRGSLFCYSKSVAAAGNQQNGNDDQPDPVVTEEIAEAVIHGLSSLNDFEGGGRLPCSLVSFYAKERRL